MTGRAGDLLDSSVGGVDPSKRHDPAGLAGRSGEDQIVGGQECPVRAGVVRREADRAGGARAIQVGHEVVRGELVAVGVHAEVNVGIDVRAGWQLPTRKGEHLVLEPGQLERGLTQERGVLAEDAGRAHNPSKLRIGSATELGTLLGRPP